MEQFLKSDIDLFSVIVLLIILINFNRYNNWDKYKYRLFSLLIFTNILLLVTDSLIYILDGINFVSIKEFNLFIIMVYYILNPVVCILWSLYVDYYIFEDKAHSQKILRMISIPTVISTLISISSIFTGYYFYLDAQNSYHRGALFPLLFIICYFYLAFTFIQILREKNKIPKSSYQALLVFAIPPTIGGILQAICFGISLIWPAMVISMLIIYLNVQNEKLSRDYLTKVYNRRELDSYLRYRISNNTGNKEIAGIMLDIDDFKKINDQYGHIAGDKALEFTADILRKSFRENDFIARYAGDEFIIILEVDNLSDLDKAIERICKNITQFNETNITPYQIKISMGYAIYDSINRMTAEEFMNQVDQLMYEEKKKGKEKTEMPMHLYQNG